MHLFHSDVCSLHNPESEILSGKAVPYFESPQRLTRIKTYIQQHEQTTDWHWIDVDSDGTTTLDTIDVSEAISRVHDADYVEYLEHAYELWTRDGGNKEAVVPEVFPHPALLSTAEQQTLKSKSLSPLAKAGLYCFDLSCSITADTFTSTLAAVRVALRAANHLIVAEIDRTRSAREASLPLGVFALTRPPGHHAGSAVCGGYCFFNNVAIAARYLQSKSKETCNVAILDIDYHHGNGTQEVFYEDPTVLYASVHAEGDYPYFTGTVNEKGRGPGLGFNYNFPLPQHTTGNSEYISGLKQALNKISEYSPDWLIVSLGVDTYKDDPICNFQLTTECYVAIGREIARLGLPTLFAMEGGHCLDALGANVTGVLLGFEGREP